MERLSPSGDKAGGGGWEGWRKENPSFSGRFGGIVDALAHHELTTKIPRLIDVALARGTERPRVDYPPVKVYWCSGEAFSRGIDTRK